MNNEELFGLTIATVNGVDCDINYIFDGGRLEVELVDGDTLCQLDSGDWVQGGARVEVTFS